MSPFDYYSEPAPFQAKSIHLTSDDVARLIALLQEFRDLTQSRMAHGTATDLLVQLTGEHDVNRAIDPEILAQ